MIFKTTIKGLRAAVMWLLIAMGAVYLGVIVVLVSPLLMLGALIEKFEGGRMRQAVDRRRP